MELNDTYKCGKCGAAHPLELDQFLKNERIKSLDNMDPRDPMCQIFRDAAKSRNLAEVRKASNRFQASMAQAKRGYLTAPAGVREQLMEALNKCPGNFCVFKAIGMKKKICVKEMKEVDKSLRLEQFIKLFTKDENENVDHWLDITSRSTLLSSEFFGGNTCRIYQFPVKVTVVICDGKLNYECQLMNETSYKPVVSFHGRSDFISKFGSQEKDMEWIKLLVIGSQAAFSSSKETRRDTISDLRIVYHDLDAKPKIWIQSPGMTLKDPPKSTSALTPVHCADQNGEFNEFFGTDMKNTRAAPVLETKIKKNEDIMERLRRLEMNNK